MPTTPDEDFSLFIHIASWAALLHMAFWFTCGFFLGHILW